MSKSSGTTFSVPTLTDIGLARLQKGGGQGQIKYINLLFNNPEEIIAKLNNNLLNLIKLLDAVYLVNSVPTLLAKKLSELPKDIIQQIVTKESFLALISNIKEHGNDSALASILEKS